MLTEREKEKPSRVQRAHETNTDATETNTIVSLCFIYPPAGLNRTPYGRYERISEVSASAETPDA